MSSKTTKLLKTSFVSAVVIALALAGCSSTQNTSKKKVLWPGNEEKVVDEKITVKKKTPVEKGVVGANKEKMKSDKVLMPAVRKLVLKDFTLTYIDKEQADGGIDALPLQHPLSIVEEQIGVHMAALTYKNYSKTDNARPVFSTEDIEKTKRLLTKALNKAHPHSIIGFEVVSKGGSTQGQLFANRGVLHWRFFKIRGVWFSKTRSQFEQYGTWKMVPGNGQWFHKAGKPRGNLKWTNWIEANINLLAQENLKTSRSKTSPLNPGTAQTAPSPSQASPPKTTAPEKSPADLEEKLKFLKYLHENQLIDKREYEQKRKDLLNQYL